MFPSLNCRGKLLDFQIPRIMGILNVTPDSFSDGGQYQEISAALAQVFSMLEAGAELIDIGGYSSRPYADPVSEGEERDRVLPVIEAVQKEFPEALISVDTFRASVGEAALRAGAHLINDISAGALDAGMMDMVGRFEDVPYIMMHMQGTPQDMQDRPAYEAVTEAVATFFTAKIRAARKAGIKDIVLDPGFGFGKTQLHNYELLGNLGSFKVFDLPLMVGLSRKSMMYKFFDTEPTDVLEIATALHLQAMQAGAKLLRVHDVEAARRIRDLYAYLQANGIV
ncbi:MAG: dihydropteroate synthase [Bacteroidota bacterium]